MPEVGSFEEFMARVRAGDSEAAAELVRRYEPAIRVIVRARLGTGLRRQLDSVDVCQSVLGTFFARAALGQYDLATPEELVALLARMTRNKVASQARHHTRECRDSRREVGAEVEASAADPSPERVVEGRELLAQLRARLDTEEREIADRRAAGEEWAAIAEAMGGTAEARRKQLARAIDRLAPELGLVGDGDE